MIALAGWIAGAVGAVAWYRGARWGKWLVAASVASYAVNVVRFKNADTRVTWTQALLQFLPRF